MRTLSSFNRTTEVSFVVTCILVQKHEATSQEGVVNFHLCLCLVPISVFLNSDVVAKVPFCSAQAIRVERSTLDRSCLFVDPSHMEV